MVASLYEFSVGSFVPMLRSLSEVIGKAAAQSTAKKTDASALVDGRLASDMFPLTRQVQLACDHAKDTVARLTGTAAPSFPDNEKTLPELKQRIAQTLAYLDKAKVEEFEGADKRAIELPGPPGMKFRFTGEELLRDWALPHFYFHVVTAYDILRHKGIDIGKRDYLSNVGKYIRSA